MDFISFLKSLTLKTMKKILFFTSILISFLLISCNEIDNFKVPNCTVKGQIIDAETGLPFESRIADNIALVRMLEDNPAYPNPAFVNMRIMENGTFGDNSLPATAYKFYLQKVPMVNSDTVRVQLSPSTPQTVVIKGIPYLRIALNIVHDSLVFSITKPAAVSYIGNITEIFAMYDNNSRVNDVFTSTLDSTLCSISFTPATQVNVLDKKWSFQLKKVFPTIKPGKYYFRMCARLSGADSDRRNFSPTIEAVYSGQ
jgi:hypothetical protein